MSMLQYRYHELVHILLLSQARNKRFCEWKIITVHLPYQEIFSKTISSTDLLLVLQLQAAPHEQAELPQPDILKWLKKRKKRLAIPRTTKWNGMEWKRYESQKVSEQRVVLLKDPEASVSLSTDCLYPHEIPQQVLRESLTESPTPLPVPWVISVYNGQQSRFGPHQISRKR